MYRRSTVIINETGLHARPAAVFVMASKKFQSNIWIKKLNSGDTAGVNGKSVIGLLVEEFRKNTKVEISAEGTDEEEAVTALIQLVDSGCGE